MFSKFAVQYAPVGESVKSPPLAKPWLFVKEFRCCPGVRVREGSEESPKPAFWAVWMDSSCCFAALSCAQGITAKTVAAITPPMSPITMIPTMMEARSMAALELRRTARSFSITTLLSGEINNKSV